MNKRHYIALIAACSILAVAVVVLLRPEEPTYQGKRASEWLKLIGLTKRQHEAYQAFRAMGKKAVPFLVSSVFEGRETTLNTIYAEAVYRKVPYKATRYLPNPHGTVMRKGKAATVLGKLGTNAVDALL